MVFPSAAAILQNKLGIAGCPAFDVQAVCSGFVYALTVADAMIRTGSAHQARWWSAPKCSRASSISTTAPPACCSATAPAPWCSRRAKTPGILASDLHADGKHVGILCVPGTCRAAMCWARRCCRWTARPCSSWRSACSKSAARATLAKAGKTEADIDWLIPHQANIRIMQGTAKKLKLPMDKLVVTVDEHGNTSAASIPLALDEAVRSGKIKKGDTLMLEGVGGGFTWGAVLLDF
jgi:3-oxoacyl-[acyl-carrier-protein] synthase-3